MGLDFECLRKERRLLMINSRSCSRASVLSFVHKRVVTGRNINV